MSSSDRAAPSTHAALLWFGVSGVLALGVDVGVLALAQGTLGHYGGRVLSFWAAATFTWGFNRWVTFGRARAQARSEGQGARHLPMWREYLSYFGSMAVGGAVNYGTYAAAVATVPLVHAHPSLGVALGSLVGMGFNFLAARRILAR
jgi:putative flippase GtrA